MALDFPARHNENDMLCKGMRAGAPVALQRYGRASLSDWRAISPFPTQRMPQDGEPLPMWGFGPTVDGTKEVPMELQVMMQSLHNAALHRGRIRHLREVYAVRVPNPKAPVREHILGTF